MAYIGARKPRSEDPELWATYFQVNPHKKSEYPKMYELVYGKEEVPAKKSAKKAKKVKYREIDDKPMAKKKVPLLQKKNHKKRMRIDTHTSFWSDKLNASIKVHGFDLKTGVIGVRIVEYDVMSIEKFLKLGLREYDAYRVINPETEEVVWPENVTIVNGEYEIEVSGTAVTNFDMSDIK